MLPGKEQESAAGLAGPSLRTAILNHVLLAALVPVSLIAVLAWGYLQPAVKADIQRQNRLLATQLAQDIERELGKLVSDLKEAAEALPIDSSEGRPDFLPDMFADKLLVEKIYTLNRQGHIEAFALNPAITAATDGNLTKTFPAHIHLQIERPTWSAVYASALTHRAIVTLVQPDGDRWVAADVSIEQFKSSVCRFFSKGPHQLMLLDHAGRFIFPPHPAPPSKQTPPSSLAKVLSKLPEKPSGIEFWQQGHKMTGSAIPLADVGWWAVLAQNPVAAHTAVAQIWHLFWIGIAVAFPVALLLALILTRRLSQPLDQLGLDASRIALIHADPVVTNYRYRELFKVAGSMNKMAAAIRQRISTLHRVASQMSETTGIACLDQIVAETGRLVGAETAMVGRIDQDRQVHALAICRDKPSPLNFSYPLAHGPCADALATGYCFVSSGVRDHYPHHGLLKEMEAEGYLGMPLKDPNGQVLGILSAFSRKEMKIDEETSQIIRLLAARAATEIDRQRTLQALQKSEERFRAIANYTNDWEDWLSPEGKLIWINPAVEHITGYSRKEYVGLSDQLDERLRRLFVKEDWPLVLELLRTGLTDQTSGNNIPFRLQRKDGRIAWVSISFQPIYDPQGRYLGLRTSIRDISHSKATEIQLRRLSTAIENAAEDIIITDLKGTIQYVNPAFEIVTGYKREEAIGQNPRLLKSDHHDLPFYQDLWSTISSGRVWTGRVVNRRKDGRLITQDANIAPIRNPAGTPIGYVSVKRDVTEQIRLESQLQQAQKMEAIGTLAGGIAHDFNNILSVIIGNTEIAMLHDLPKGHSAMASMEQVLQAARRATSLVQQILSFSRQEQKEHGPMDVGPIVKEVYKLLRATLPTTIDLQLQLNTKDSVIVGDPTLVHQIVMNLCTNAAHAMRQQGGVLEIRMEDCRLRTEKKKVDKKLAAGEYLRLVVGDTGHGMTAEICERIFNPYFTTKNVGEGTGLGLSVVHGIVQQLNGSIEVESIPETGTAFTILLPKTRSAQKPNSGHNLKMPGGKERLLIVDDETGVLNAMHRILHRLGYQVDIAKGSQEARVIFEKSPHLYDLVVTDMTMPQMTGDRLARRLLSIRPDLPIILVTGFNQQITEKEALKIGIARMLMKPIPAATLAEAVRSTLDQSPA